MTKHVHLLYDFARPHTIIATSIQVITILIIVAGWRPLTPDLIGLAIATLIVCLALNLYVVGMNQLTDIEIDRINKPWLPIAAGRLSMRTGQRIVVVGLVIALTG
ncbi:MAG: homogentisate phytyltransferase, partial [Chloroflexus aggregans]